MEEQGRLPYLYITGASFSGSTLLSFLLNAHPAMFSVSEVCGVLPHANITKDAINSYPCSCGARLLDCPFYRQLEAGIRELGSSFDLRDWQTHFRVHPNRWLQLLMTKPLPVPSVDWLRYRAIRAFPGVGRRIRQIALRNLHFARTALQLTGKRVFVDAQKDPSRVRFLSELRELDVRVIHLIRDVRGGASSYMKHYPEKNDARTATRKWLRANCSADWAMRCVEPERRLRIRYDDLCSDYQKTIDRITDFVGVPRAAIPEDFRQSEHHIVGNKMRRGSSRGVRQDDSWRRRLKAEDLVTVSRVGGKANRYFGFDWPGGAATRGASTSA